MLLSKFKTKLTVRITVRRGTFIWTLKCTCNLLEHINGPFRELFVILFFKSAQTADGRIVDAIWHPSFFFEKRVLFASKSTKMFLKSDLKCFLIQKTHLKFLKGVKLTLENVFWKVWKKFSNFKQNNVEKLGRSVRTLFEKQNLKVGQCPI